MALFLPEIRDVVVLLLLVNLPAEAWVVWHSRRDVSFRGGLAALAGIAVGIPVGGWILVLGRPTMLLVILGACLIVIGGVFLVLRTAPSISMPRWSAPTAGLISGLLTGLFGTGGPPLVLYFSLKGLDKSAFRGNLMFLFLSMTVIRVPAYAALGLITAPRLAAGLAVFPAVLAGAVMGHRIHLDLSESAFRTLVAGALVVLGLVLLIR